VGRPLATATPRLRPGARPFSCASWALVFAIGCSRDPAVTLRTVTMHTPLACAIDGSAYAEFYAFGDFEPTVAARGHVLGDVGDPLPEIDGVTRALVALANEEGRAWQAESTVAQAGDVDMLLLPSLASCPLSTPVDARVGAALAPMGAARVLVVGGTGNPTPRTFVADLTTGAVKPIVTGLLTQRTRASVTAFGDGALVAGGVGDDGTVLATAEVYSPELQGFDQQRPIQIGDPRADPGAVVLATGETLLVGGVGSDLTTPLSSMEIVDPVTRTVRTEEVAQLAVARRAPSVLRLASGEVLVAGGFDAGGRPVATLEWFAADASGATKRAQDLVTASARSFAPLVGGGALAVIAPPASAPSTFQSVWVIDADGALEAATPVAGSLTAPVLFDGAGGAPVLWTGDRWLRWQPWIGAFGALGVLDDAPASVGSATCSPDAGLALWLAADAPVLTGLRFDVRGAYTPLSSALFVADTSETAPDRLPGAGVLSFDASDSSTGLAMGPGASAFVTDRTYADVTIDVDSPTGEPAIVVLRDELGQELEVGGATCPGVLAAGASSVHVARAGVAVSWSVAGGAAGLCPTGVRDGARLSVGVRAPASAARSVVRNLRVTRVGPSTPG
jgi:hypothetical protein